MKVSLLIETDEAEVRVTPQGGTAAAHAGPGGAEAVAAPNWSRLAQIALCVTGCLASATHGEAAAVAAGQGGQHQSPPVDVQGTTHARPR